MRLLLTVSLGFLLFLGSINNTNAQIYTGNTDNSTVIISQPDTITTQGWKTQTIKVSIRYAAKILRGAGDVVEYTLKKAKLDSDDVRNILNNRYKVADALDDIADTFDYISQKFAKDIYDQLVGAGMNKELAWAVANFIEKIAF